MIDKVVILFATSTGTAEKFSHRLADELNIVAIDADVTNVSDVEAEERLTTLSSTPNSLLVIIASTFTDGSPPEPAKWFFNWVEEAAKDFR